MGEAKIILFAFKVYLFGGFIKKLLRTIRLFLASLKFQKWHWDFA